MLYITDKPMIIKIVIITFILALITNFIMPLKIDYHGPNSNIIRYNDYKNESGNTDVCYRMTPYEIDCP